MSETITAQPWLSRFCTGIGLDIGAGDESPIVPTAITIDKRSVAMIVGDAEKLTWFSDGCLDYVYSSHCLEDFTDTGAVLSEWLRVIKPGGYLVLFCPDQKRYEEHCTRHLTIPNQAHKHPNFSIDFVISHLKHVGVKTDQIVHFENPALYNSYSFALVVKKL